MSEQTTPAPDEQSFDAERFDGSLHLRRDPAMTSPADEQERLRIATNLFFKICVRARLSGTERGLTTDEHAGAVAAIAAALQSYAEAQVERAVLQERERHRNAMSEYEEWHPCQDDKCPFPSCEAIRKRGESGGQK